MLMIVRHPVKGTLLDSSLQKKFPWRWEVWSSSWWFSQLTLFLFCTATGSYCFLQIRLPLESLGSSACSRSETISSQEPYSPQFLHEVLQTRNKAFAFQKMFFTFRSSIFLRCAAPGLSPISSDFCTFLSTWLTTNLKCFCSPCTEVGDSRLCLSPDFTKKIKSAVCGFFLFLFLDGFQEGKWKMLTDNHAHPGS